MIAEETSAHYTVLARRFRPQAFDEVVGQEHVAQGLRNAIQQGRVAHAYLFTGARGVGKTSMARILAKALNCPNTRDGVPCNQCDICRGISIGHDVDVLEIDGASNRGIDDIRSLRANVNVKSMRSKHKIYIIDEVHMLTKEAFNALLKTLEEPPPNVKFVFCTTEPNKLPDTILSRCQRFDFGTIATLSIAERLTQIAEAEGIAVEADAVELVARRAAGSMRDSQSLFDQLLAFGGERITAADVHRLLGTASDERLLELMEALVERRRETALELFSRALDEGVQLGELTDQLLACLRDLMVAAAGAEAVTLLGVSESNRSQVVRLAERWGLQTIVAAMQILAEAKGRMQRANYGRALAELALVRISLLEELENLDVLIQQLKGGGDGAGSRPAAASSKAGGDGGAISAVKPATPASPASSGTSTSPRAPQKKSDAGLKEAKTTVPTAPSEVPRVEFRDGCERALWAEVLGHVDDMVKRYVRCVSHVAISGPNRLDLTFPRSYHWNKQYCEKPEILGQIESLASKIAGQPIRITLLVAEGESQPQEESKPASRMPARKINPENDEFVQQAVAIFGATLAKVDSIASQPARKE